MTDLAKTQFSQKYIQYDNDRLMHALVYYITNS